MVIDWNTIASIATAVLVGVGVWEIRAGSHIAQSEFEESLDRQYRELARDIPVDALIGGMVPKTQWPETRELIYNYLDLCNEQVFLRKKNRIRKDTWRDWCAGMRSHLEKPAFLKVWNEVKSAAPRSFAYLERLEANAFRSDPKRWG